MRYNSYNTTKPSIPNGKGDELISIAVILHIDRKTYEKTIKNFFIDNYNEEIKDGDLICTDLIYYSKELKKKVKDK